MTRQFGVRVAGSAPAWRWVAGAAAAVLPPGPNLVAFGAIWAVSVGAERTAGIVPAALLSVGALGANLVLYMGP